MCNVYWSNIQPVDPPQVESTKETIICIVLSQVLPWSFSQEGNEWDALGRQGLSNVLRKTPPLLPIVELSVSVELRCDLIVCDMVPCSFSVTGCIAVAVFPRVTVCNCLLHLCTQTVQVFWGEILLIIDIRRRGHLTSIFNYKDSTC